MVTAVSHQVMTSGIHVAFIVIAAVAGTAGLAALGFIRAPAHHG